MDRKKKWFLLDNRAVSNLTVVILAILFYFLLNRFDLVRDRIASFLNVLSPFIVGFAIAYLLNSPVRFFEERVYSSLKQRRILSIVTVYLMCVALLAVLSNLILPQVVQSIWTLGNNMSDYLKNLNQFVQDLANKFHVEGEAITDLMLSYQDLMKRVGKMVTDALPKILDFGVAVGSGVIAAVTALISSIYMLSGKARLLPQVKKIIYALIPKAKADWFLGVCRQANGVFVGFINGKLIDSAIIGVLCYVLNLIFRIPSEYAILIAVVIGATNIIPFFGPIIGAVPCMMILLIVEPWAALRFGILVIALQQFDGNILGPKILGNSTGLSALWVLVAIVVGGGLFGFPGMILGVPTFAVLYALIREWVRHRLELKGIDGEGNPLGKDGASNSPLQ